MTLSGESADANQSVDELVKFLAEERNLTSIEIAETLWLALQMEPATTASPQESTRRSSNSTPLRSVVLEDAPAPTSPPIPAPPPRANLNTPVPKAGVLPTQALPVWISDPAMLTDSLAVMRALKPLLRQIEAGTGRNLDEPATVELIARTRLWLPVLKPDREPWFDIVLIVDRGSSMHIWQRLVSDIVRILRRYGAFRNVQAFDLQVDQDTPVVAERVLLYAHPDRPGHRPSELIDQRGRRIAIVLSDCAGEYWWDGTLLPMLEDWGYVMPTIVWQMLPAWMWKRTALGRGDSVAISNDTPGVPNQQLTVRNIDQDELENGGEDEPPDDTDPRLAVPVVTSELQDLQRWSLMVAGDRREVVPGFRLPPPGGRVPRTKSLEALALERVEQAADIENDAALAAAINRELEAIAADRVRRFRQLSSPQAQRLIMLLAAAPVITMPVVRLIRDAILLDETQSPLPVAEVFLSGLLQRVPGQGESPLDSAQQQEVDQDIGDAQDLVQYDFVPKVRETLLQQLPPEDTIDVVNGVSAAVEYRWKKFSTDSFRAFLTNPQIQEPEELSGLRSFASVTADILAPLGGKYAAFADQLRYGDGGGGSGGSPDLFPELEDFEFVDARYEDDALPAFPPPLQSDEFTVITVDLQPGAEPDQGLEPCIFTIATLIREGQEWVIQRQRSSAYRFVEALPVEENLSFFGGLAKRLGLRGNSATVELEMVAIPGGTFVMGSPHDEPERYSSEGPQHEVSIESFFMGRYPVTQAQWRAVAALPQVQRELKTDPSRFKGDDRPVENVSWNDAVEFCARLSAQTGRDYRLPTEAEWEYACRAGTTTPFHFGETISSELANYGGSAGERRGETTPVEQFGVANAFGLSDMHGNVWEWCQDHWHENYEGAPTDGSAWLEGGDSSRRVRRGGSWIIDPRFCRSAFRYRYVPDYYFYVLGFRVCCAAPRTLRLPTD
jgi:formylglycine-generating enzyme required for sulfatase activity